MTNQKTIKLWSMNIDEKEAIELIYDQSINLNYFDKELERSIFYRACGYGRVDIIKPLLDNVYVDIYKLNINKICPLCIASQEGKYEIIKTLLSHPRVDIEKYSIYESFKIAIFFGYIDIVTFFLQNLKIDINKIFPDGSTGLGIICEQGHLNIIDIFLNHPKINLNLGNDDESPLYIACKCGKYEIVKKLLSFSEININIEKKSGVTPLYITCQYGFLSIVELLLEDKRIDVNKRRICGADSFFISCEKGHYDIINRLLKDSRIDVNRRRKDGTSPFEMACEKGNCKIVDMLLKDQRILVNEQNNNGLTPLHIACATGNYNIVDTLLKDPRITLNETRDDKLSPLDIACISSVPGNIKVVERILCDRRNIMPRVLLENKPLIKINTIKIAKFFGYMNIVNLFEEFIADKYNTTYKLRKKLKLLHENVAEILLIVRFFCNGYFKLFGKYSKSHKFFNILYKLPIELQMVICNRLYELTTDFVNSKSMMIVGRNILKFYFPNEFILL